LREVHGHVPGTGRRAPLLAENVKTSRLHPDDTDMVQAETSANSLNPERHHVGSEDGWKRHVPQHRRGLLRKTRAQATRTHLVAVGARCRRSDLGTVLRLESRTRVGGLGRFVRRGVDHLGDVFGALLFARGDVACVAAHRWRVFVRAHDDGAVGWFRHGPRREHRIHHDSGRDRVLHRLVSSTRRPHSSPCGGSRVISCSLRSTTGAWSFRSKFR
jgi:hypothetical protein